VEFDASRRAKRVLAGMGIIGSGLLNNDAIGAECSRVFRPAAT